MTNREHTGHAAWALGMLALAESGQPTAAGKPVSVDTLLAVAASYPELWARVQSVLVARRGRRVR